MSYLGLGAPLSACSILQALQLLQNRRMPPHHYLITKQSAGFIGYSETYVRHLAKGLYSHKATYWYLYYSIALYRITNDRRFNHKDLFA